MHNDASNAWLTPTDYEANTAGVLFDITHLCSTGAYIQCSCKHTALRMKQMCAQYGRAQHIQVRHRCMATGFWTGPDYLRHVHLHVLTQFYWIDGLDQHMHVLIHLQRVNRHIW